MTTLGNTTLGQTAASFSHNSNGDQLIVVHSNKDTASTADITGITYNAVPLTQAVQKQWAGGTRYMSSEIWYLDGPASGSNTLAITYSQAPNRAYTSAISVSGLDLSSVLDSDGHTSNSANSFSVTVDTRDGGAVFYSTGDNDGTDRAYTPTGDAVELGEYFDGAQGLNASDGYFLSDAASSTLGTGWVTADQSSSAVASFRAEGGPKRSSTFFSKIRDFHRDLKLGLLPPEQLQGRYGELLTI